jgi:hypothetical protein
MIKTSLRLASSAVLLLAAFGASAKPPTTKPLAISGVFQEQIGPSQRCPSKTGGALAGYGSSAQLGSVAFVASDCITPVPPLFNFSNGRFMVLTGSGEQIFASYSGQFVPTGEGSKFVFSGATFQVTGGTGQYARATGGGTLTGGSDIVSGAGSLQLSGQISYEDKAYKENKE